MKARILSLTVIVLLSVASVYASNPKVYRNINDKTKEYTLVDSETLKGIKKFVYNYDSDGILQERVLYNWNDTQGWVGVCKYSYEYNNDKLAAIVYTKWDKGMASGASQHIVQTYNANGELLTNNNLMATK